MKMFMILLYIIGVAFLTTDAFAQKPGGALVKPQFSIKSVEYQKIRGVVAGPKGTPGKTLDITGSAFGLTKGRVMLRGLLKPSGPAPALDLEVVKWSDSLISAKIPAISGVLDSNAIVVVMLPGAGGKTATFPLKFIAARETQCIPVEMANRIHVTIPADLNCQSCAISGLLMVPGEPGYEVGKLRAIASCNRGFCREEAQGIDRITIDPLKNGWVLKDDTYYFNEKCDHSTYVGTATPRITGPNSAEVSWKTTCKPPTYSDGSPGPSCSPYSHSVTWAWSLLIEGPKGVPFR